MGSSYRQDLNCGSMKEWESQLREASDILKRVIDSVYECACEEDQTDNAADDGALTETLRIAKRLIDDELPSQVSDAR